VKIALIAPLVTAIREPHMGGSQAFLADLATGLSARGHLVHVWGASGSSIPGVDVIDTGIDAASLTDSLYRAGGSSATDGKVLEEAFRSVYAMVRDVDYDVVHNHAFDAPAIRLATVLRSPVVHTLHLPPNEPVASALAEALDSGRPPAIATISNFQTRAWKAFVGIDVMLPPGVPTARIPWSETTQRRAVFAGRLSPEKGAEEAIDIAIAAGLPIDVYGDPYDAPYAEDRIYPRDGQAHVAVHGAVGRAYLWEIMSGASVVLCPAIWDEPFGMVAAEAHAAGTPVVAFRRGALPEVVADGITGFLVEPGDLAGAANAVKRTPEIDRAACRRRAALKLDLERSLDAHEELYRHRTQRAEALINA
jgi:glycosyltransferase involved in cell wall biosynthesis